jgi:signal transduction histidine kinase
MPQAERGEYEALVASVEDGLHRVLDTVNALRELVHPRVGHKHEVKVREAAETALRLLGGELKGRIQTELKVDPALSVHANKSMLLLVLMNLIKNAADALNGAGASGAAPRIEIHARADLECIRLSVRDNGPGIAPEHQARVYDILGMGDHPEDAAEGEAGSSDRVFKHFFTTKESGAGMGLGLGICRRIVRAHGGRISFRSEPGAGCEFILELPLAQQLEVAA